MKIRLLNAGLFAFALLMSLSSCSSDETLAGDSNAAVKSMKINISDGLFTSVDNNGAKTRATDTETTTSFSSGDAIGIFVVKSDGTLALANAKYTYDGTSWLNSSSTETLPYFEGAKYFAYYPYQENLSNDKFDATKTTAKTFFASLISGWTPAADQSTQANYTAQDLMVSMATVDASTHNSSFVMSHQMSMIEMDLHQVHYTYGGADAYRFTFGESNKPFNIADGKYRLLVNPSNSLSITGNNQYNSTDMSKTKAWSVSGAAPAAAKYKIYKYNGASANLTETSRQNVYIGDANIGDYLYSDGTSGTVFKSGSTVGIIFSSELTQAQYNDNCRYGKVLAIKNANNGNPCYWSDGDNSPYTNHSITGHPYATTLMMSFDDISSGYDALSANSSYVNTSTKYAWYYCKNFNDGTTKSFINSGWYLPSAGEWWDVMENLGIFTDAQKTTIKSMRTSTKLLSANLLTGLPDTYFDNLNTKLTAAGGNTILPGSSTSNFWCASEYSVEDVVYMYFGSDYILVGNFFRGYNVPVRAVLAF